MENTPQDTPQKRPRGRPKSGFNKIEYDKQYREQHKIELKEYAKNYNKEYTQKILKEKGVAYNRIKENSKQYIQTAIKALKLIKSIKDDENIPLELKNQINSILN